MGIAHPGSFPVSRSPAAPAVSARPDRATPPDLLCGWPATKLQWQQVWTRWHAPPHPHRAAPAQAGASRDNCHALLTRPYAPAHPRPSSNAADRAQTTGLARFWWRWTATPFRHSARRAPGRRMFCPHPSPLRPPARHPARWSRQPPAPCRSALAVAGSSARCATKHRQWQKHLAQAWADSPPDPLQNRSCQAAVRKWERALRGPGAGGHHAGSLGDRLISSREIWSRRARRRFFKRLRASSSRGSTWAVWSISASRSACSMRKAIRWRSGD